MIGDDWLSGEKRLLATDFNRMALKMINLVNCAQLEMIEREEMRATCAKCAHVGYFLPLFVLPLFFIGVFGVSVCRCVGVSGPFRFQLIASIVKPFAADSPIQRHFATSFQDLMRFFSTVRFDFSNFQSFPAILMGFFELLWRSSISAASFRDFMQFL